MSEEDLKINSRVRRILVENNLDVSSLSVSTASGAVTVRGELKKVPPREMSEREEARLLGVIETTIQRAKGVKRVAFLVKNWKKDKGKWKKGTD